jgi:hypothetical protein
MPVKKKGRLATAEQEFVAAVKAHLTAEANLNAAMRQKPAFFKTVNDDGKDQIILYPTDQWERDIKVLAGTCRKAMIARGAAYHALREVMNVGTRPAGYKNFCKPNPESIGMNLDDLTEPYRNDNWLTDSQD